LILKIIVQTIKSNSCPLGCHIIIHYISKIEIGLKWNLITPPLTIVWYKIIYKKPNQEKKTLANMCQITWKFEFPTYGELNNACPNHWTQLKVVFCAILEILNIKFWLLNLFFWKNLICQQEIMSITSHNLMVIESPMLQC
jgi:hypothetical protein